MEAKKISIKNQTYICQGFDGYNGHYYTTVYTNDGDYLGQIVDCNINQNDSKIKTELEKFLENNL